MKLQKISFFGGGRGTWSTTPLNRGVLRYMASPSHRSGAHWLPRDSMTSSHGQSDESSWVIIHTSQSAATTTTPQVNTGGYFRFCGWRLSESYRASCVFIRGERAYSGGLSAETFLSILAIKNQQILIVGCTLWGRSLLSMIDWLVVQLNCQKCYSSCLSP